MLNSITNPDKEWVTNEYHYSGRDHLRNYRVRRSKCQAAGAVLQLSVARVRTPLERGADEIVEL